MRHTNLVRIASPSLLVSKKQDRNEVCDQSGRIRDQKGRIWGHSSGISDQKSRDRDQQFLEESGCTIFVGSGSKICHAFGIKDQKI